MAGASQAQKDLADADRVSGRQSVRKMTMKKSKSRPAAISSDTENQKSGLSASDQESSKRPDLRSHEQMMNTQKVAISGLMSENSDLKAQVSLLEEQLAEA